MSAATGSSNAPPVEHGLPQHVRTAFGVRDVEPIPLIIAGGPAWRCADVLIRPVTDHATAAWSAGVLDGLTVEGLRLARPLRSSDGRWVVAGASACRFLEGRAEPRYDEVIGASLRLHAATAAVRRPRLLDDRDDLLARADAAAWGERKIALDPAAGGTLFDELAAHRRPIQLASQVVHGELFGTVLFHPGEPPAVLELIPFWRPVEWAAAIVAIDALAWGGADHEILRRWAHLAEWPQALLRALLYRVAIHAQHPAAGPESLRGLERTATLIAGGL